MRPPEKIAKKSTEKFVSQFSVQKILEENIAVPNTISLTIQLVDFHSNNETVMKLAAANIILRKLRTTFYDRLEKNLTRNREYF